LEQLLHQQLVECSEVLLHLLLPVECLQEVAWVEVEDCCNNNNNRPGDCLTMLLHNRTT
jgi:hypothetical protein